MPRTPARAPLLRRLDALRRDTLPLFALPPRTLARRYRRGGWDVRTLLLHLVDTETVLADRLRRIAAEELPLLLAFDQDAWAARLCPPRRDLGLAQALFDATRSAVIELLAAQPAAAWQRTGVHNEAGLLSFGAVAAKVADHHAHHLAQLRRALD